jgi:ribosomal protein S18 acetylase RimI-like enzyme
MGIREVRVSGRDYLALATQLLQRARLADGAAGAWEAADIQWWWRMPRSSDRLGQQFWLDANGPVAAALLIAWDQAWECTPILVAGERVALEEVWTRAVERIEGLGLTTVEVFAQDDDARLLELLSGSGFEPDVRSWFTWMDAGDRPEVVAPPEGFVMVDRHAVAGKLHPMRLRNGDAVETRLRECSLYDPELDLAVETPDGDVAGYALFWSDPVTRVGLVEPMRVEDAYQRRGLGRALLTEGLARLAARGARRLKVGFVTEPARGLYLGAGFQVASTGRSYRSTRTRGRQPAGAASG